MTTLTLADYVRESAGRRQFGFDADLAGIFLDGGVFHFHVRKTPLLFRRRNKGNKRGVFAIALLQMVSYEVADRRSCSLKFRLLCRWTMRTSSFSSSGDV